VRAALALGLATVAVAAFVQPSPRRSTPVVPVAPKLEHTTSEGFVALGAEGLLRRIEHTRAKGVVVNVWASWCGSCKGDLPILVGLRKTFGTDIDVLLVSVDDDSGLPKAAEMLRGFGAPPPNFVVDEPLDVFKPAMNPRWPGMLPATFLFDPAGKLRYFWGGPVHEDELTPLLHRYLSGEHIDGEADYTLAPGAVTR
jgi:thiol-disulfide isomerase/thioredoxin